MGNYETFTMDEGNIADEVGKVNIVDWMDGFRMKTAVFIPSIPSRTFPSPLG